VIGDCRGVFVSTGIGWRALERTEATGAYRLRVPFPVSAARPLLRAGRGGNPMAFTVEPRPGGRSVVVYSRPDGGTLTSRPFTAAPGRHGIDLVLDHRAQEVGVTVDGRRVLEAFGDPAVRPIAVPFGAPVVAPQPSAGGGSSSRNVLVPADPTLCHDLTDRERA
jgi:hypothetical protein